TTIGVLPLIFGGYAAYHALFERRNKKAILIASIAAAAAITLFLRLIPLRAGILILTCMLSILAAQGLAILFQYFKKTRVPTTRYVIVAMALLFFIFASALPALTQAANEAKDTPTSATINTLQWARDNLENALILATPKEGFLVAYEAQQKTVIDRNYLLVKEADALFDETEIMYRSHFALPVLEHTQERGITHILFSDVAQKTYARERLLYTNDCFDLIFEEEKTKLYEVTCNVKTE
ncbi:hypothetical protein GOV10_05450, partial [Candidatus Woesearchaeota archaeon]|nr:hypothetical protein [Candidatus Woesearchaeota archaeon]